MDTTNLFNKYAWESQPMFALCVRMSFNSLCWSQFGAVIEVISVFNERKLKTDLF